MTPKDAPGSPRLGPQRRALHAALLAQVAAHRDTTPCLIMPAASTGLPPTPRSSSKPRRSAPTV